MYDQSVGHIGSQMTFAAMVYNGQCKFHCCVVRALTLHPGSLKEAKLTSFHKNNKLIQSCPPLWPSSSH